MKLFHRFKNINNFWIFIFLLTISCIAVNEFVVYEWCFLKWNVNYNWNFPSNADDLKLLFIADPQLIGFENEKRFFEDIIRWDADQFLAKGFSRAIRYTKPDIIVFLGDIFDEGELASDSQFESYMERFNQIFSTDMPDKTKVLIIPGDNDVGGEGASSKSKFLMERFYRNFKHEYPYLETYGNINFIPADVSSQADLELLTTYLSSIRDSLKSKHNILLNHHSFGARSDILSQLGVTFFMSAHSHFSRYKMCHKCSSTLPLTTVDLETYERIQFQLTSSSSEYIEITVPTCSYRMGVSHPGYGYMTISKDGLVSYSVLWLPHRFTCFRLYQLSLLIIVITFALKLCRRIF